MALAGEVERRMRSSVRTQVVESIASYAAVPRPQWVRDWPAMVVLAVSAIYWSKECEDSISGGSGKQPSNIKVCHLNFTRIRWHCCRLPGQVLQRPAGPHLQTTYHLLFVPSKCMAHVLSRRHCCRLPGQVLQRPA